MQAILKSCIQIEERVGSIYHELSQHPTASKELKSIWREMAEEEIKHAHRIQLVAARLQAAGITDLGLDATQTLSLFDRAGELLLEAQQQSLSIEQAIYATVELEDAFMQVHLSYGSAGKQPDVQTMFRALAEEDRQHTARIKAYIDHGADGLNSAEPTFSEPED
ncbi:MAG: hypothetical protein OET90_09465 [Desulfuromonadales bacterium]|nr:hypothetical protein [Desulfuromonadales bacterium]